MSKNKYNLSAVTAILLAILFPMYWLAGAFEETHFIQQYRNDVLTLSASDLLFVVIGLLEVCLYLSLRRAFADRIEFDTARTALLLMAMTVGVFHATVLFDVYYSLFATEWVLDNIDKFLLITAFVGLAILFMYAVFAIVLGVSLLRRGNDVATLLKVFAVMLIVIALLQASVIFSVLNVFLFPVAVLLLAVYFLRSPEVVDLV